MPMTEYSGNTAVIAGLGTNPAERGLTTEQFKAKFDEALAAFVAWFNETHGTEFDAKAAGDHTHGSITNDGKLGSTPDLPVFTGAAGAVGTKTAADALTALGAAAELIAQTAISASATLALAHQSKTLVCSSESEIILTVPPNSSVAFEIGTVILVTRAGAGAVTFAAGSGVTISSADDKLSISKQHAAATLLKTGTDSWSLLGALS